MLQAPIPPMLATSKDTSQTHTMTPKTKKSLENKAAYRKSFVREIEEGGIRDPGAVPRHLRHADARALHEATYGATHRRADLTHDVRRAFMSDAKPSLARHKVQRLRI